MIISHLGFILVDSETVLNSEENSNMKTMVDNLVKLTKKENWGKLGTVRKSYNLLHKTRGGVKLMLETIFVLIRRPKILHRVSTGVLELEKELHNCTEQGVSLPILQCIREKIGSSSTSFKLFENVDPPSKFRLKCASLGIQVEKLSVKMYNLLKMISPLGRVFLFIFDSTKGSVQVLHQHVLLKL